VTENDLPIQTVGHIAGYCLGQQDTITAAHHATWKNLQTGIVTLAPKGLTFPSFNGKLTIGHLWEDNKMDEICTINTLWEAAKDSEMKKALSPKVEEALIAAHKPQAERQGKARKRFLRVRLDGIEHHTEKRLCYLLEFKRTSDDVRPDYLEKERRHGKQAIRKLHGHPRKAKGMGWTSEQLNFIIASKSINEEAMHKNLEKIGINRGKKEILRHHS
jgi:hypothetical protein